MGAILTQITIGYERQIKYCWCFLAYGGLVLVIFAQLCDNLKLLYSLHPKAWCFRVSIESLRFSNPVTANSNLCPCCSQQLLTHLCSSVTFQLPRYSEAPSVSLCAHASKVQPGSSHENSDSPPSMARSVLKGYFSALWPPNINS